VFDAGLKGWQDLFISCGNGKGNTWRRFKKGKWQKSRLDRIYTNQDRWECVHSKFFKKDGADFSDHKLVRAILDIGGGKMGFS